MLLADIGNCSGPRPPGNSLWKETAATTAGAMPVIVITARMVFPNPQSDFWWAWTHSPGAACWPAGIGQRGGLGAQTGGRGRREGREQEGTSCKRAIRSSLACSSVRKTRALATRTIISGLKTGRNSLNTVLLARRAETLGQSTAPSWPGRQLSPYRQDPLPGA